jgi:hypothetical protein
MAFLLKSIVVITTLFPHQLGGFLLGNCKAKKMTIVAKANPESKEADRI